MIRSCLAAFAAFFYGSAAIAGPSYIDPTAAPYNAVCHAEVDDSIPLQSAINDAAAQNTRLYIPSTCYFGSTLTNPGVSIYGAGHGRSALYMLNPDQTGMVITSGSASGGGGVVLRDFSIGSVVTPTSGACVVVNPGGSNVNTGSRFENLGLTTCFDGIDFERAAFWTIRDPNFGEPTLSSSSHIVHRAVIVRNLVQQDYGDSLITGGLIATGPGSLDGIYQESSAGLKVIGTKIVGSPQNCFHLRMVTTRAMGPLIINSNSFEGCTVNGIFIEQGTPGYSINGLEVIGNQIGSGAGSGFVGINITSADHTAWIRNPSIVGNGIMVNQSGSMGGIIVDGLDNATISGNSVMNNSGPISGYGYIVGSYSRNGVIRNNSGAYLSPTVNVCAISPVAVGNPGPQIRFDSAYPCL